MPPNYLAIEFKMSLRIVENLGGDLRVFGMPPLAVCLEKFRKFKIYFGWIHLERIAISFARWNSPL